jgi:dihydrolipoamide dehydrogenase
MTNNGQGNQERAQVVVIGAGPGGYTAAFLAADLGLKVTLIDPDINPGGVCLYRGCIPTKALLHVAKTIDEARLAKDWGLTFAPPEINLDKVRAWKDSVVQDLTNGLGVLYKRRNVRYIQGTARFLDSQSLEINEKEKQPYRLLFEKAIIATGARSRPLPGLDFTSPRIWDSTKALQLTEIPSSLLIIGAGYIGLELGSFYAMMGSKVTIAEMLPVLLPVADRDIVAVFAKQTENLFSSIRLSTLVDAKEQADGVKVIFRNANRKDEILGEQLFDKLLVTIGRIPNHVNLGLEKTKVEMNEKGFIKVNEQRRTTDPSIYAIGDITGEPLLAHKASHEGVVAAEALAGQKTVFDPRAIPAVEYTEPEIAWCGLTEEEAKAQKRDVKISKFPWAASGRALTLGRKHGLTKLIIEPGTEKILGVAIVGTGAGELISEAALAIEMAAVASDLRYTIHPHPTLSETIMEAAAAFYGVSTSIYRPKLS